MSTSMLRITAFRSARTASRRNIPVFSSHRAIIPSLVRFESSQSSSKSPLSPEQAALKAARKHTDELQRDWNAPILTYEQLKPKTENPTPNAYIIDVREPDEVIQGMIPSAVNLPLSMLANSLHLHHVAFKEKHGFDKPLKEQELVFYCRSGMRSTTASDVAKRNGYTNILNYKGSWLEWTERENKTS